MKKGVIESDILGFKHFFTKNREKIGHCERYFEFQTLLYDAKSQIEARICEKTMLFEDLRAHMSQSVER